MTPDDYRSRYTPDDAVGWQAIDAALGTLYGERKPLHFAPPLHYIAGGNDPLDGISVYLSKADGVHHHFVTYGFSELYYNDAAAGGEFSRYGFELTFRLKKESDNDELTWACNLLQNLARYVFETGKWFENYDVIKTQGPICRARDTALEALAFIEDPELGSIATPHGSVQFIQLVGLTLDEYSKYEAAPEPLTVSELLSDLRTASPLLVTDLTRTGTVV